MNINELTLKYSEIENDWAYMIFENDGFVKRKDQLMVFQQEDLEIAINYNIEIDSEVKIDDGDYWTPPTSDFDIKEINIEITEVTINEYEVELNEFLIKEFNNVIKKNISI